MLPPSLYTSKKIGSITGKDGTVFEVALGLDERLVAELKAKSRDETDDELMRNTSDKKRFGEGSYEKWYAKDRTPLALLDAQGHLAAFIFIGPRALPDGVSYAPSASEVADTIAFRSYAPYRGKGVMKPFGLFAIDFYMKNRPGRYLWLEVNADNEAGQGLYTKLGFTRVGLNPTGRIVMVRQ